MLIEVKYAIGDKVRYRHATTIVEKEDCTFCNGSGEIVSMFDGTIEECPRCDGRGYLENEYDGTREYIGTIRDIQVYYYGDKNPGVPSPYVLYRMNGWNWSQTWIAESSILEVLDNDN